MRLPDKKQDREPDRGRQAYEKPRLRIIPLSADEVLGSGCKTSPLSTGFGSNLCTSGFCSSSLGS
ncbi:MAG: hypothetical protein JXB04_02645 [Kiritimatiellae bacterium]|nr:hypothetical protein [Kiritimatiellia bacterium]